MDKENNTEILERNLKIFKKRYPEEAKKITNINAGEFRLTVTPLMSQNPEVLQVTTPEGRKLVLGHLFGHAERDEEILAKWGSISPKTPILIIGSSNINRIRKILEAAKDDCLILVYEPSIEIFRYVISHFDMSDILDDCPIVWKIGSCDELELKQLFFGFFVLDTMATYKQIITENYEELFPEEVRAVLGAAKRKFEDMIVTWNTMRRYTDVVGENMLKNIRHYFHGYNVNQVKGILKGKIPAVVVSAGPSLNKNIEDLRLLQGKACIIAVDTAVKPLLNRGIVPDFFVIVDGKKPTHLMDHPEISKVALVTSVVVSTGIMDLHEGKKFFYRCEEPFENSILEKCNSEAGKRNRCILGGLESGGSVANNAFAFAALMNPSQIILVGQDLAITNGRTHADGTFKEKMDKISEKKAKELIPIEGIRGNIVHTRRDFHRYLLWFEDYIARKKMKNVIDATQGGARIHGAKLMTLRAAAQKYATHEIDIQAILNELPEMLDWNAKRAFKILYEDLPNKMENVYQKAKQGESAYKRLEKIATKGDMDQEKLKRLFEKITKNNKFMNSDREALFVQSSMQHLNFLIRMGIYEEEEDEKDELIQIAKHGKVLNFYIKHGAKAWKEQMIKIVEERPIELTDEDIKTSLDRFMYELMERSMA